MLSSCASSDMKTENGLLRQLIRKQDRIDIYINKQWYKYAYTPLKIQINTYAPSWTCTNDGALLNSQSPGRRIFSCLTKVQSSVYHNYIYIYVCLHV